MLIETLEKEFLQEKKFEGLKESTLRAYADFFKDWNKWLGEQGLEQIEDISSRTIKQFLFHCTEIGNNPKTINTKIKLLRTFSKWLVDEGLTKSLLTEGIKAQREDQKPKLVATEVIKLALPFTTYKETRRYIHKQKKLYFINVLDCYWLTIW
ncbi:site-specific integrase [Bacillus thuringiensis]|nr:site-specific integrase [Bacillus thuringiensis]